MTSYVAQQCPLVLSSLYLPSSFQSYDDDPNDDVNGNNNDNDN